MEQHEIISDWNTLPPELDNTLIRSKGPALPDLIKYDVPATNRNSELDTRNNVITFELPSSSNMLDPYSLYLNIEIENINKNPIKLDHSAHSLISRIVVSSSGQILEDIRDYDFIQSLLFDMNLNQYERSKRKKFEGFGDNEYGTNETIIYPKIENTEKPNYGMNENDTMKMDEINNWKYVIGGKLAPFPFTYDNDNRHKKLFKIPLCLRTIGFGIPHDNYKLIPLNLFNALKIEITINHNAFFVPKDIKKIQYLTNEKPIINLESKVDNLFVVKKRFLHTEQYRFKDNLHERVMDKIMQGGWTIEFPHLELIDQVYCSKHPTYTYTKQIQKDNIKALYIAFTNDLYKHSKYARKLARYNHGITKISFKAGNYEYPPPTTRRYNSLNTDGDENSLFFYNELRKCTNNDDKTVITQKTFTLDYNSSHAFGLFNYAQEKNYPLQEEFMMHSSQNGFSNKTWSEKETKTMLKDITEHKRNKIEANMLLPEIASKCIYGLSFDTTPNQTNLYRNGINLDFKIPFIIEITKDLDYLYNDIFFKATSIYFFEWILFERYVTIKLDQYGLFHEV